MIKNFLFVLALSALGFAQRPVPQLPRLYIDTTYNQPTGTTWNAHTSTDFKNALKSSNPGDVIVLDAGVTYSGNFTLPAKANPNQQWIYIISSGLGNLPAPGTRVGPTDAKNMAQVITPNGAAPITAVPGANHFRLVGLEAASASTAWCNLKHVPPINCGSFNLVYVGAIKGQPLPDSITVDRCYIHGSPTMDIGEGVLANGSNVAVIDSYISDIHLSQYDSQAVMAYLSPGPLKIVNNYLSATTENIMLGGAGGSDNPYVPSDVEIRNNWLFKPLEWAKPGVTIPPNPQWSVKNSLEFKSAQRVLADGNILENNWQAAQDGTDVLFTVRSSASGNNAVVDDITFTNNIIKNVPSGFTTLTSDFLCGKPPYQQCTNPGESKRILIGNNLLLFRDPSLIGGGRNTGIYISDGLSDYVLQHNTFVPAPGTDCFAGVYFMLKSGTKWPPPQSITHNMWILDNAFCRQTSGDFGGQGTVGLNSYMGDPAPVDPRYLGNVMYVPSNNHVQQWPLHNFATTIPFTYVDPSNGNYQLLIPLWLDTSDGAEAGIDNSKLPK